MQAAVDATVLAFGGLDLVVNNAGLSLSKALLDTTVADWDLQHNVMAKGSFLVSRAAAKVLIEQRLGGDIVYISTKNSLFAGPNNIAYSATKADQAHQVRLLAAELGEHGVKVNGINPDGVVRGSGIFAGGWGAKRAAVYGVTGGGPGQVLRPAHPAQARGAARARGQRGLRALLGRPVAHHRPAHPGRRRRRRGLPPVTMPPSSPDLSEPEGAIAQPGSDKSEVFGAIDIGASSGRVVAGWWADGKMHLDVVHRFPNGAAVADGHLRWNLTGLYEQVLVGSDGAGRALPGGGQPGHRHLGGRLRPAGRRRPAAGRADRVPGRPDRGGDRRGARPRRPGASCTRSAACSSCRSTPSTSSPPSSADRTGRGRSRPCCCPTCWPSG